MKALHEYIADHQTGDPDTTAIEVFKAIGLPEKWRTIFYGVVRDECRRLSRNHVRDLEIGQSPTDTHGVPADPRSRTDYLLERFYNGAEYVLWGTATVDDHLGRIAFQESLRGGIERDIERHREAIEAILAAGVSCLNDLATEVAA